MAMTLEDIQWEILDHWADYHRIRVGRWYDQKTLEDAAMVVARRTKRAMENVQAMVPGMTDREAWTEVMGQYAITATRPQIPRKDGKITKVKPDNTPDI